MTYVLSNFILALTLILSALTSRSKTMIILVMMAFFQSLFWVAITPEPSILTWDLATQNNVALCITQNGYVPKPLGGIYRAEYVSYPSSFILWAILSEITSIPTNILIFLPILTYSMYILLLWVMLDALNTVEMPFRPMIAALLSIFIVNFKLTEVFIYQNYGRTLLLFTLFLLIKELMSDRIKSRAWIIVIIISTINVIFSHSESSIALLIASTGFIVKLLERSKESKNAILIPLIALVAFSLYHFYNVTYFAVALIDMLKKTLEYILKESSEIIIAGSAKYTPYDYTTLELVLYGISLFLLSLSALVAFTIGVMTYLRDKKIPFYLGSLTFIGASFILIFWFSPYKSDISLKFLPALSIVTVLSFIEVSKEGYLRTFFKKHFNFLRNVLIVCSILIILGFAIRSNSGVFSNLYCSYRNTLSLLDFSGLIKFLATMKGYKLVFVDSPSLPYYFTRDYIVPRLGISYNVIISQPEVLNYNYRLVNGILMSRPIMNFPSLSTNILQGRELIMGAPDVLVTSNCTSILFNIGLVSIGIYCP